MNRIGIRAEEAVDFIKKVQKLDYINLQGIFSHLANSDNEERTKAQLDKWENILANVNTDGLLIQLYLQYDKTWRNDIRFRFAIPKI